MALSSDDQTRLTNLRAARDKLATGQQIAKVVSNGRTVEYGKADIAVLTELIEQLEAQACAPVTNRPFRPRGRIRFSV